METNQITKSTGEVRSENKVPQRILVVDDESDIRQLCTEVLIHHGFVVDAAEDGAAAWDALQRTGYDLLVTDNNMCRMTGVELIKKLHEASIKLPIIMVSGAMPTDELNRHPWLRIDAALLKPFTTDELVGTVRQVLRVSEGREAFSPAASRPADGPETFNAANYSSKWTS